MKKKDLFKKVEKLEKIVANNEAENRSISMSLNNSMQQKQPKTSLLDGNALKIIIKNNASINDFDKNAEGLFLNNDDEVIQTDKKSKVSNQVIDISKQFGMQNNQNFMAPNRKLFYSELNNWYIFSIFAKQIIDTFPDDATRGWRKVFLKENGNKVEEFEEFENIEKKLDIRSEVNFSLKMRALNGGFISVVVMENENSDDDFINELTPEYCRGKKIKTFLRLVPQSIILAKFNVGMYLMRNPIEQYEYLTDFRGVKYHISRCIVYRNIILPPLSYTNSNNIYDLTFGISSLVSAQDDLVRYNLMQQELETQIKRSNVPILQGALPNNQDALALGDKMLEGATQSLGTVLSSNELIATTEQGTLNFAQPNIVGLYNAMDQDKSFQARIIGIPQSQIFGELAGGMNTTGNDLTRGYAQKIDAYKKNVIEMSIHKLDKIILWTLGYNENDYLIEWSPWLSVDERSDEVLRNSKFSRSISIYNAGLISKETLYKNLVENDLANGLNIDQYKENDSNDYIDNDCLDIDAETNDNLKDEKTTL